MSGLTPHRLFLLAVAGLVVATGCKTPPATTLPAPSPSASEAEGAPEDTGADAMAVFARDYDVDDVTVSPQGTYLAVRSERGGASAVSFLNTETKAVLGGYSMSNGATILSLDWASDDRVVIALGERNGPLDDPIYYGDLVAVDVDGGNVKVIFGFRAGEQQVGSRIRKAQSTRAFGYLLDRLPNDKNHILVRAIPFNAEPGKGLTSVYKVNIQTGLQDQVVRGPGYAEYYVTDENGRVRAALAAETGGFFKAYLLEENGSWQPIDSASPFSANARPISFSASRNTLYIRDERADGTKGLFAYDVAKKERSVLWGSKWVTPHRVIVDRATGVPAAVRSEPDYSKWVIIEPNDLTAQLIQQLSIQFRDQRISIRSQTADGKKTIALVSSDRDPGTFFLMDGVAERMIPLLRRHDAVDPRTMRPMEPFKIKARDGTIIGGYLTLPSDNPPRPPPMVVMPHGGPHGVRDYWGFDSDAQLLASQGFAVLQVNFRGSGGYGPRFELAGYEKWGDAIQEDIIDAIRWAVIEKVADPTRICTYGGSFGGYSAVMLAIRAPQIVRCAVGVAGVYDLARLVEEGDIAGTRFGRDIITRFVGSDPAALRKASPVHNVAEIEAPILLIHGEDDQRAPISHAKALADVLGKAGKSIETKYFADEGHGFKSEVNRLKAYRLAVEFMRRHMQDKAPSPPAR